jgi:PucR family transcriptional regulator, purine catabolism regulatory protein
VLTTAIGCGHNIEEFEKFVQDVIDSGASALAVALGRHIYEIPKEVIEMAEKNNFIIIEIPWEVRFSSVIESVMVKLNNVSNEESKRSEKVQQELLNLILKEKDLACISTYLHEHLGFPVIITDQTGTIHAQSQEIPNLLENWKGYVVKGIIPAMKSYHHPRMIR